MAINRFYTMDWDQPISSFVPLPFEAAYAAGERIQKDVDDKLSKLSTSTDPFSKLDFSSSFKVYDPTNPLAQKGVVDYNFGNTLGKQRDMVVNNLAAEREQLVNDWDSGKITNDEFNRQVAKHVNKSKQLYGVLANAETTAKSIKDISKKLIENKDYGLRNHLAQEQIKYNTDWLNNLDSSLQKGIIPDYNPFGVADKTDVPKEVKDYFGSLGKEVLDSASGPTGTGYIRTHYREGVTKDKISNLFSQWYDSSPVKNDIKLEGYDMAYRANIDPEQEIDAEVPDYYDPKTKKIVYKTEKRKWIDDYEEKRFNEVKDLALGFKSSSGRDSYSGDSVWMYKDKLKRLEEEKAFGSTLTESGINTYDTVPESLKKYIKNGELTVENIKSYISGQPSNDVIVPGYGAVSINNLPKGWTTDVSRSKEGKQYLIGPDGKRHEMVYQKIDPKAKTDKTLKEVRTEINNLADRYDISPIGKNENQYFNEVLQTLQNNAVTASRGVDPDPQIRANITKDLVGTDKKASTLHFTDIYSIDHSKKLSGSDFFKKNEDFDRNTMNMIDFDWTAPEPATKTFSVKNSKTGEEEVVRVTSKNINEKNHFKPAYSVIQDIQKFNQNKDVKYKKTQVGKQTFVEIGAPELVSWDGSQIQAIYKPASGNQPAENFIAKRDLKTNNVQLIPIDDYKIYTTNTYYAKGAGQTYTKGINENNPRIQQLENLDSNLPINQAE